MKNNLTSRSSKLSQDQINAWFSAHLPYLRAALLNHIRLCSNPKLFGTMSPIEQHRVRICTYEMGVVTCRKFIEFLGLSVKYNPYQLIEKRDYYRAKEDGNSYEVKVIDLGGTWVELKELTDPEKDLLTKIYLTGHRATVHLTDGSPYQGEWQIFDSAVELVDRLLKEHLYDIVGQIPKMK